MEAGVVDIAKAENSLSTRGESIESGTAREISICRDGRPVAKLVVAEKARIGVARGIVMPGDGAGADCFDIATLFRGE